MELGIAVAEDAPVRGHQPVPLAIRGRRHAHDRLVEGCSPGRTIELSIAVAEDAPVGRHQPVAVAIRGRRHAHDRFVEGHGSGRASEQGIAVAEDPPVRRHEPVAALVGGGRDSHDRLVQPATQERPVTGENSRALVRCGGPRPGVGSQHGGCDQRNGTEHCRCDSKVPRHRASRSSLRGMHVSTANDLNSWGRQVEVRVA